MRERLGRPSSADSYGESGAVDEATKSNGTAASDADKGATEGILALPKGGATASPPRVDMLVSAGGARKGQQLQVMSIVPQAVCSPQLCAGPYDSYVHTRRTRACDLYSLV